MSASGGDNPDLAALQNDIAALKRDFSSLLAHLRSGATNTAQNAAETLDEGAHRLYGNLAAEGERSMKAISRKVEDQPLVALLIAFGVGYIGGRLLSR